MPGELYHDEWERRKLRNTVHLTLGGCLGPCPLSNVGVPVVHEAFAYLQLGGLKNFEHLLRFLSDHLLMTGVGYDPPEPQPRHGVYHPDVPEGTVAAWRERADPGRPTIGVLFYRAHWLSGNTDFVDALVRAGEARGANVLPVYAYSLKEPAADGRRVGGHPLPDLFLGDLPRVYPFIVNNPGEGAQAKRRTHAVIVDHLTPPLTTAEGYGEVEELTGLVDEYFQLEQMDPAKLPLLQQQIWALIQRARLDVDLGQLMNRDNRGDLHPWDPTVHADGVPYTISDMSGKEFAHLVENLNGYLCELTSAQIRDGLHVLGQPPAGRQLVDTLLALVRLPNLGVPSLRAGIAAQVGLDLDELLDDLGRRFDAPPTALAGLVDRALFTHADALEAVDALGRRLVDALAGDGFAPDHVPAAVARVLGAGSGEAERTLRFVCEELVPNLRGCTAEIGNVLHALEGGYVPAGPSGAPTRGMAHVLPTGRNFYTVDPRALPSLAAWRVGQELADALLARHRADEGGYPRSVGIAIWGTSAMRTHGDDVAQVLALLGVRPRWQAESRRVVGVEVVPPAELGRPRIDVVCRISGFFRDAFPHLIALLDEAFRAVASLDEPPEQNYVRAHQLAERERLAAAGVPAEEAAAVAYRIFGCRPGTYGAGILPLIDEGNWRGAADFAEAYVNWGGYACTAAEDGVDARPAFRRARPAGARPRPAPRAPRRDARAVGRPAGGRQPRARRDPARGRAAPARAPPGEPEPPATDRDAAGLARERARGAQREPGAVRRGRERLDGRAAAYGRGQGRGDGAAPRRVPAAGPRRPGRVPRRGGTAGAGADEQRRPGRPRAQELADRRSDAARRRAPPLRPGARTAPGDRSGSTTLVCLGVGRPPERRRRRRFGRGRAPGRARPAAARRARASAGHGERSGQPWGEPRARGGARRRVRRARRRGGAGDSGRTGRRPRRVAAAAGAAAGAVRARPPTDSARPVGCAAVGLPQ